VCGFCLLMIELLQPSVGDNRASHSLSVLAISLIEKASRMLSSHQAFGIGGEIGVSRYLSSDPKIAMHSVAAKYAVGDGDAATMETQWTTSVVPDNHAG
jgi:hypothetical protein